MTQYISQAELHRLALSTMDECGEAMRRALDPNCVELLSVTIVRASELLPTYRTRLGRWRDEGEPLSLGMEAFVAAIENHGDSDVALVGYRDSATDFVVLLREDLGEVLGIIVVNRVLRR